MSPTPGDLEREKGDERDAPEAPEVDPDEGLSDLARAYRSVAPVLHLGWTMAAALALATLGGAWLDNKLDTKPWLTLGGAVLGLVGGLLEILRTVRRL